MGAALLTIAISIALLMTLLAIPLSVSFSINRIEELEGYARFRWLFGLVNVQARFPRATKEKTAEKLSQTTKPKLKPKKSNNNVRGVVALLKQSVFRRHLMKFIKDVLRATHAQDLYFRLRIGLGDPAETGMLWAVMGPLSAMMKNLQAAKVEIEPEFIDSVIEIESHGQFRLIPLQFIGLTIVFMLSPTTRKAWRTLRQVKQ